MAQKVIDRGTKNDPATGDTLWTTAGKVNDNFTELYDADTTQDTAIALNTAKVSLETNSVVEAKLAPQYKGSSVISASEVDWLGNQVRTKTITGNTVLTFANLYVGVKDLEISGNFTLGFPTGFKVISGTYDGTVLNLIEVICTDSSTPAGWIVISQEA